MSKRFDTSKISSKQGESKTPPGGSVPPKIKLFNPDISFLADSDANFSKLEVLLQKGGDPDQYQGTYPPLHRALRHNAMLNFELLLQHCNPNRIDGDGTAAIHIAAEQNNREAMRLLLDHTDIDENKPNRDGLTALHIAAKAGHMEIVQALLDAGAKREPKERYDQQIPAEMAWRVWDKKLEPVTKRRIEACITLLEDGKGPKSRQAIVDKADADLAALKRG